MGESPRLSRVFAKLVGGFTKLASGARKVGRGGSPSQTEAAPKLARDGIQVDEKRPIAERPGRSSVYRLSKGLLSLFRR